MPEFYLTTYPGEQRQRGGLPAGADEIPGGLVDRLNGLLVDWFIGGAARGGGDGVILSRDWANCGEAGKRAAKVK